MYCAYDFFISHNHADKAWVRRLADELADQEYNGRRLRPWLDEHFLDPGSLSSEAELTTALDRSRFLGLVLSPEAVASRWVDFELRYFTEGRGTDAVIPLLRRDCSPPAALAGLPVLDFRDGQDAGEPLRLLLARLCPPGEVRLGAVERAVDAAFRHMAASDPGGFWAEPTPERDAFFDALMRYDIDDAGSEGWAVAAFDRAAEHLLRLTASESDVAYNVKMLLGECLAAALHRSVRYRQVAQHLLDRAEARSDRSVLLFVVVRAYSKLAEIDRRRVDTSVLLRAAWQLDAQQQASNEMRAIEGLLARVLGKLRDTPEGELVLKTLSGGGRSSRIAAAGAISLSYERSEPVFYLSELERRYSGQGETQRLDPPSRRLLGEIYGLPAGQDPSVIEAAQRARQDLEQAYPGTDLPYGLLWPVRREEVDPAGLHLTPFAGRIAQVTLENMVERARAVDASTVACLTEPRIVDALFDGCSALLIPQQDPGSPQCRRLRARGIPFALLAPEAMTQLADGTAVVVDRRHIEILNG